MSCSNLLGRFRFGLVALSMFVSLSCAAQGHKGARGATTEKAPSLPEMIENVRGTIMGIVVAVSPGQSVVPSNIDRCFNGLTCVVGTGFFVSDKADLVTAAHVADDVEILIQRLTAIHILATASLEVALPNYETHTARISSNHSRYDFRVLAKDDGHDIAILSPTSPNLFEQMKHLSIRVGDNVITNNQRAVIFDLARPRDGEDVFACGYPLGAEDLTTTSGHIATSWASEVPKHARDSGGSQPIDVYRLDLTTTFGDSGGPAFRSKNQAVIGMVVGGQGSAGGGGWTATIIPSHYITELLDKNHVTWKSSTPTARK